MQPFAPVAQHRSIFFRAESDGVDFETHAADLLHALCSFYSELHLYNGTTSPYWHFLRFIVRRCHAKIAERMQNGEKIWKKHPIALLEHWDPPTDAKFPDQEFPLNHQILESTLSLYGINAPSAHSERKTFHFGKDNAKAWAQTACVVYGTLEKRLFTPHFEGNQLKDMPRASMDLDSIKVVADYLDTFLVLLDLPSMKSIFSHPSFTSLLEPLEQESPSHPQPSHPRRGAGSFLSYIAKFAVDGLL